jgi:hypothetical protein
VSREPSTITVVMQPPRCLDERNHSIHRFVERWWPYTDAEKRLRNPWKKAEALRLRLEVLHRAVCTGAYHVENIPDERQSIWAFVVQGGPNRGRTALMVVSEDGIVRTVLPPEARRPANRRRVRSR